MRRALPRLHAITDGRVAGRSDLAAVARALAAGSAGALALHARGHLLSGRAHCELATVLCSSGAAVFVNDRLDIALAVGAAGVQLRPASLPPAVARRLNPAWWIGRSVHSLDEARTALAEEADYLLVGPVYETATHPEAAPLGTEQLGAIARLGLPVIAIGGIVAERVPAVRRAGAYGVAAIRALWDATDPGAAAGEFVTALAMA